VALAGVLMAATAMAAGPAGKADSSWEQELASSLAGSIEGGSLWFALLAAWIGGVLTSFTPCVYPLIPITVRYFGAMRDTSRGRVVRLAAVYVGGMVVLYASIGTAFAATGTLFGSFLANPWVVGSLAVVCAAMGVSMLGLFSLQLPSGWSTRLSQVGGQSAGGAFGMGLVSGLIAAPCTGPVLLVILTLIAKTGAIFFGFWLMVAFGLGLGVPFLLLAVFSGSLQRLPSGGTWMELVKTVLATAMFVVAVYFIQLAWPGLRDIVHELPISGRGGWVLAAVGLALGILYLRSEPGLLRKVTHVATLVTLTVGLSVAWLGSETQTPAPGVAPIVWISRHDDGMAVARSAKKPVMIDFTADWCAACKELDRKTFVDAKVRAEATRFVAMKLDATEVDAEMEQLWLRYGVLGLPAVVFIDSTGTILEQPRVTGFVPPAQFVEVMSQVE
jgi:thiol:disulfide interchange protein DsbD